MQNKTPSCYDAFADYYNRLIDCDYDKWSQFLIDLGCGGKGIDLACGTGNITFRLAEKGCAMIGVDSSQSMLAVAESKKKSVKNPMFRLQDMTEFNSTVKVDFVTCVCDGINYVAHKDVAKVFANVFECLACGGKFVFDISSAYKLKNILGNNFFYQDEEDVTYFWTNSLKKDRVVMDLSFFVKDKEVYNRFDERHVQYIYEESQIKKLLLDAGFSCVRIYADYCDKQVKADTQRIVFCAEKPNAKI